MRCRPTSISSSSRARPITSPTCSMLWKVPQPRIPSSSQSAMGSLARLRWDEAIRHRPSRVGFDNPWCRAHHAGHARWRGKGRLLLGSVHGEAVDSRIAMLLEIPGLSAEWDPMIRESSVRKFPSISPSIQFAAIMGSRNGALRALSLGRAWWRSLRNRCRSYTGIRASPLRPRLTCSQNWRPCSMPPHRTVMKMLQDVIRGGPTEIEALNGMIVRTATEMGTPAPLNRTLTMLIQSMSGIALGPD